MMRLRRVLSPKSRAFAAAKNCSAQQYSTESTVNVDGVHWEKTEGGCQKKMASEVQYSRVGSKFAVVCSCAEVP